MFDNEEQFLKWLEKNHKYEDLSKEEIDKQFIETFGIEEYERMEKLTDIDLLTVRLCNLLDIEPIPAIFEHIEEDSRYYEELDYISINEKYINDDLEIKKSLIHEIKHQHQKHCIYHKNQELKFAPTLLIRQWEADFKKNQRLVPIEELNLMSVEVDAYAFTKYILKEWFDIDYHYPNETYDQILTIYINKYFK